MLASLLSTLLACQGSPKGSDARRYTQLLSHPAPTQAQLQACAALHTASLQGDCGLVLARRAAETTGQPPETFCAEIPDPVWRSECFFMAAEDHNQEGNIAQAAQLCLQARHFTDHCSQHLWQRTLRGFTWHNGSQDFLEKLPSAQRLYDQWQPFLEAETDFPVRFWRRYYEGGFERARHIDLAACAALPTEDRLRCRAAGSALFARQIEEIIRIPRAAADFCASPADADALSRSGPPQFSAQSDPDLNAVIARLQASHCTGTPPTNEAIPPRDPPFEETL